MSPGADLSTRQREGQLQAQLDQAWEVFIGFCCVEHLLAEHEAVDPKVHRLVSEACESAAVLYSQALLMLPIGEVS